MKQQIWKEPDTNMQHRAAFIVIIITLILKRSLTKHASIQTNI